MQGLQEEAGDGGDAADEDDDAVDDADDVGSEEEVAPSAIEHQDELLVFSWCQGFVEDSERALELQVVHPRTIVSPQMNVVRLFCGYVS